jgi:5-methylcytosine-specific restriction endonuclease McrA
MPIKDPEKRREDVRIRQRMYRTKAKKFLTDYKESRGCFTCKESFGPALEFHHLHGKDSAISTLVRTVVRPAKLLKEIQKCVVLCSNCHRKVHYGGLTLENLPPNYHLQT